MIVNHQEDGMEWKSTDTAPLGEEVLVSGFIHNNPREGRWVAAAIQGKYGWYRRGSEDEDDTFHPPTHWMPFPEPPAK